MTVEHLLDDVEAELTALWGAGLALPGPERATALQEVAERLDAAGLAWASQRVRSLADALVEPDAEVAQARQARLNNAHTSLQHVATWLRTFRSAWALERVRRRLSAAGSAEPPRPSTPTGYRGTVWPVGLEVAGPRWQLHAVQADGSWVTLADEVSDVHGDSPLDHPLTSRLFQDRVRYREVLNGTIELTDHPPVTVGGRTVFRPSFHARPRVRPGPDRPDERGRARVPRLSVHGQWTPEGWVLSDSDRELVVAESATLAFNLHKWASTESWPADVVGLERGGATVFLDMLDPLGNPCFPAVDPEAVTWSVNRLRSVAKGRAVRWALAACGVMDAGGRGPGSRAPLVEHVLWWWAQGSHEPLPTGDEGEDPRRRWGVAWSHLESEGQVPVDLVQHVLATPASDRPTLEEVALRGICLGGTPGRALVESHVARLRKGVASSGVLPGALSLWAIADALARLRGVDPQDRPLAALQLPIDLLRLSAVEPLSRWVRTGEEDEDVLEAWLVVVAAGDGPRFYRAETSMS